MASFSSLPVFTGHDYDHWRIKMKTFLKSQGLWDLVSETPTRASLMSTAGTGTGTRKVTSSEASTETGSRPRENLMYSEPRTRTSSEASTETGSRPRENLMYSEPRTRTGTGESWMYSEPRTRIEAEQKDAMALYYIQQSLSPTIFSLIVKAKSAKSAWDILANKFQTVEDSFIIYIPEKPKQKPKQKQKNKFRRHEPKVWAIRKIPVKLREVNVAAYTHQYVLLGPLHFGKPEPDNIKKLKLDFLNAFLSRTEKNRSELTDIIRTVEYERDIRNRYSEYCNVGSDTYVELILLDSLFILELLMQDKEHSKKEHSSSGQKDHKMMEYDIQNPGSLREDLLLFENQIPFYVLRDLFSVAALNWDTSFIELCVGYFSRHNQTKIEVGDKVDALHFTDLMVKILVGDTPTPTCLLCRMSDKKKLVHTATKLSKTGGVKFSPVGDKDLSMCNKISLNNKTLALPILYVFGTTECIYRNCMVSEQVNRRKKDTWFCSYILLLSFLIKTREDVVLLVGKGIIVHDLDHDQQVVDMINKLCTKIKFDQFHYSEICEKLNRTCHRWWFPLRSWGNGCVTILNDIYFNDFWRGTATVAAVFLLLLTLIQSITSILQVMPGHK